MCFDDRVTNRQPHAEAVRLGRVERIEDALGIGLRQPGPESHTVTSTPSVSILLVLIKHSRVSAPTSLIASIAFMIRFRITCCNWTLSPRMCGSPSDGCIFTKTLFSDIAARVNLTTPKIASFTSKLSFCAGAVLEKSRIRFAMSAARLPSLTTRSINGLAFAKFGG